MLKMVLIEWLDSHSSEGWIRRETIDQTLTPCRSIGWIVAENKKVVTISGHLGGHPEHCCGYMTIPRCSIVRMVEVKVPK